MRYTIYRPVLLTLVPLDCIVSGQRIAQRITLTNGSSSNGTDGTVWTLAIVSVFVVILVVSLFLYCMRIRAVIDNCGNRSDDGDSKEEEVDDTAYLILEDSDADELFSPIFR